MIVGWAIGAVVAFGLFADLAPPRHRGEWLWALAAAVAWPLVAGAVAVYIIGQGAR